jgi:hypothetical protein
MLFPRAWLLFCPRDQENCAAAVYGLWILVPGSKKARNQSLGLPTIDLIPGPVLLIRSAAWAYAYL